MGGGGEGASEQVRPGGGGGLEHSDADMRPLLGRLLVLEGVAGVVPGRLDWPPSGSGVVAAVAAVRLGWMRLRHSGW